MNQFTIGELEELTGVPRRTIYFYVQQGILPPPSGAGLAARYQTAHLLRIRAIPRLRSDGWRLDRIRDLFQQRSDDEIAAIAEGQTSLEGRRARLLEAAPAPLPPPDASAPPGAAPTLLARYTLAPGVDLLVQRDLAPSLAEAVSHLLAVAAAIFGRRDGAPTTPGDPDAVVDRTDSASVQDSVDGRSTEDAR